jgi:hypothetical protein
MSEPGLKKTPIETVAAPGRRSKPLTSDPRHKPTSYEGMRT